MLFRSVPAAARPTLEQRLEALQRQSDLLRRQNDALQREIGAIRQQLAGRGGLAQKVPPKLSAKTPPQISPKTSPETSSPSLSLGGDRRIELGGQYRINSYYADDDVGGRSRTASRVRLRQNFDITFNSQFQTHLQFELSHTSDNVTTTSESSRAANVDIRHAVLAYRFTNDVQLKAGIVPLSDRFGDTLFSSDWDYNPVAVVASAPLGGGVVRAFAADLQEGEETVDDDFVHYQLDYQRVFSEGDRIDVGVTLIRTVGPAGRQRSHVNVGLSGALGLGNGLSVRGLVAGSFTDRELFAGRKNGSGVAAKIEIESKAGWSLMGTYASGSSDGGGFLPVMALAQTNGYWGYTGLLTVQGPTDTGIDGDAVNISNNGFGLATVQARYRRPLTRNLDLYLAAGWFGASRTPAGRDDFVGADFLAMGTYHFNPVLALDFGVAYARLGGGVSSYASGLIDGAQFNGGPSDRRDKVALFTRIQAEFK